MVHIHLDKCESTQPAAMALLDEGHEQVLVSCETQLSAVGRRERSWFSSRQCLAMSFNAPPASPRTLTSLEMGVLAKSFIKQELGVETRLKWPNDLYTPEGKKCGGILIQGHKNKLVVGIGINLFHPPQLIPEDLKAKMGALFKSEQKIDLKETSFSLFNHIASRRMSAKEITDEWLGSCVHLNEMVKATEDGKTIEGLFTGIGQMGQALIRTPQGVVELYNATLLINGD